MAWARHWNFDNLCASMMVFFGQIRQGFGERWLYCYSNDAFCEH